MAQAQNKTSELIIKATTGYVVLRPADGPTEILIMNTDNVNTAQKIWRWNMNGFGYSSTGINGEYRTAITMDGAIVADFITAGILSANLIKAGTMSLSRLYGDILTLGGNGNIAGKIQIKDVNANVMAILDQNGLTLQNGAKLFGGNGVLSNFQYKSGTAGDYLGFYWIDEQYEKSRLILDIYIPDNFEITSAKVTLMHRPIYWNYADNNGNTKYEWGWARNIKMYKVTNLNSILQATMFGGSVSESYFGNTVEITNAFGSSSFTPSTPSNSNHNTEAKESIDIKNYLNKGRTVISIETANSAPSGGTVLNPNIEGYKQTGEGEAVLNIIGYMK